MVDLLEDAQFLEQYQQTVVEITPSGTGLHWETLDADFSVSGLLSGCFGTKTWMATLQNRWQSQLA